MTPHAPKWHVRERREETMECVWQPQRKWCEKQQNFKTKKFVLHGSISCKPNVPYTSKTKRICFFLNALNKGP